jgi:hypothetical protein
MSGRNMKTHADIYSARDQDSGWNVVQAATLLREARSRNCPSLIHYAGLEMRMAIEQILFTIISLAMGKIDLKTLTECRTIDGLNRVRGKVAPDYDKWCLFATAISDVFPNVPSPAVWNMGVLIKHVSKLNELCHSPLIIQGMKEAPEEWNKRIKILENIYEHLATTMRRPTCSLRFENATPFGKDLWEKFRHGEIDLETVKLRMRIMKPAVPQYVFPTQGIVRFDV